MFLEALRAKGKVEQAQSYEAKFEAAFAGLMTKEELLNNEVDALIQIIDDTALIASLLQKPELLSSLGLLRDCGVSPLESYVKDLEAQGFSVSVNPKYQSQLKR